MVERADETVFFFLPVPDFLTMFLGEISSNCFVGLFGVFDLYLTHAAERIFIGKVIRNRFVGVEGKSYRYFENILKQRFISTRCFRSK